MKLFQRDSAVDLLCRGFGREEILARTGEDVGYNGNAKKLETRGVDRDEYKIAFVVANVSRADFAAFLDEYGEKTLTRGEVFAACGLGPSVRVSLEVLAERLGCASEFEAARAREIEARDAVRRRTNRDRFGVDYPARLPEFVARVRETTECRHGGLGMASASIRAKAEDTMTKKYGSVDAARDEMRERARRTRADKAAASPPRPRRRREYVPKRHVETWTPGCVLFDEDSPRDLFCRGFSGDEIRARTGVECGYNCVELEVRISKSDRVEYAARVVRERVGVDAFKTYLSETSDRAEILSRAGFGPACRLSLERLCAALSLTDEHEAVRAASYASRTRSIQGTMMERYGCRGSFQSPELAERARDTMEAVYGVRYPLQCESIRRKALDTVETHYGGNGLASEELGRRIRATMLRTYGAECSWQSAELVEKAKATMLSRYGVENASQSEEVRRKACATMRDRLGVDYAMQSEAVREKSRTTVREKYGVDYVTQSATVKDKGLQTKRERHTFSTSEPEESLYRMLVDVFGETDVMRQFVSDEYPFACDFYVESRDLYVELNGFQSHGHHWFGSGRFDVDVVTDWREKQSEFYDNLVDVWTRADVAKREAARTNDLNYVVFWDPKLSDAELWFAMGCPDGRDWEREYSWLPDSTVPLVHDGVFPEALDVGQVRLNRAVKAAVWPEFYKREVALWRENYDAKWGTVQARLYANRFKYIGKLPDELTGREILRGLGISGMMDAYSTFDASGMLEFLDEYRPDSILDPCAGWGERLAVCAIKNIAYAGVDVNPGVVEAHGRLISRYGLTGVSTSVGDSGVLDFSSGEHDCVFTCPPYGSREIYTPVGAENLSPDDFDAWWRRVVRNATGPRTRVFAYQIDQVHRDAMNAALVDAGWTLGRQIPVGERRVNHMGRAKGSTTKKNFEEIQVFVRDLAVTGKSGDVACE